MTHHPDTPTVPVSLPAALDEWERLARGLLDAESAVERYEETAHREFNPTTANGLWAIAYTARNALSAHSTPERILGLIAVVRRGAHAGCFCLHCNPAAPEERDDAETE